MTLLYFFQKSVIKGVSEIFLSLMLLNFVSALSYFFFTYARLKLK